MSAELQSLLALVLFGGAIGYLVRRWWRRRQQAQLGCGSSGECACPSSKIRKPGQP